MVVVDTIWQLHTLIVMNSRCDVQVLVQEAVVGQQT